MFRYKLVLFGFPDLCRDYDDVMLHLRQVPPQRAEVETLEQCYLIDMQTGQKYTIESSQKSLIIKDFEREDSM